MNKKWMIVAGIIGAVVLTNFLSFNLAANASQFCLAHNIKNEKKSYFVIPCWVVDKAPVFEKGQRPQQ